MGAWGKSSQNPSAIYSPSATRFTHCQAVPGRGVGYRWDDLYLQNRSLVLVWEKQRPRLRWAGDLRVNFPSSGPGFCGKAAGEGNMISKFLPMWRAPMHTISTARPTNLLLSCLHRGRTAETLAAAAFAARNHRAMDNRYARLLGAHGAPNVCKPLEIWVKQW